MRIITLAFPTGRQKLESRASAETGNDSPYLKNKIHIKLNTNQYQLFTFMESQAKYLETYNNSFSRKTTGSGSLIAAFSKPRASSDE